MENVKSIKSAVESPPPTATIVPYSDSAHRSPVVALWREAFGYDAPRNSPSLAIDKKMAVKDGLLFVAMQGETVVGTAMAGYDGHRGWLYSIAVLPTYRRKGLGAALVVHAERALCDLGCMKVNLQLLASNEVTASFYKRLGYTIEPRVSMGKELTQNVPNQGSA
jgi:ribosomal protein S18 acetylase RimI-like enzyme